MLAGRGGSDYRIEDNLVRLVVYALYGPIGCFCHCCQSRYISQVALFLALLPSTEKLPFPSILDFFSSVFSVQYSFLQQAFFN